MSDTTFTPGQRVGIVSGVQAVGGPTVTHYGTVVERVEYWPGVTEYIVRDDATGQELVYRPYLLREVPTPALPMMLVGTNVRTLQAMGTPLFPVYDSPRDVVRKYRTDTGVVFRTDADGVILDPVPGEGCTLPHTLFGRPTTARNFHAAGAVHSDTDNDDAVSDRAAQREHDLDNGEHTAFYGLDNGNL